jgi:hypothetical protein
MHRQRLFRHKFSAVVVKFRKYYGKLGAGTYLNNRQRPGDRCSAVWPNLIQVHLLITSCVELVMLIFVFYYF